MARCGTLLLLVLMVADQACSQVIQQQTVQLPTFRYFGVQTTVVVPDRGSIPLGGVTYGGSMRTRFDRVGPNYGYGQFSETLGLSMGATIIDHDEMDRAVLAEAARKRGAKVDVLGRLVDEVQSDARPSLAPTRINQPRERVEGAVYLRRGQRRKWLTNLSSREFFTVAWLNWVTPLKNNLRRSDSRC